MGWWKVEGTSAVVGDEVLDVLTGCVADVVELYRSAHGRKPSVEEWECLLSGVLCTDDGSGRPMEMEPSELVVAVHLLATKGKRG